MPSKNKKQLNFFLLVKAYKEYGEIGVKRQWKNLNGYKPKLTLDYIAKLTKTADNINSADLIDLTSGLEGDSQLGDKRDFKVGYWALFRGKFKPHGSKNEIPNEGEFIAQIKKVDNQNNIVNFHQSGFRNKFGNTIETPKRATITHPEHLYLDYSLFDNIIRTGKTPQEVAKKRENLEESIKKVVRKILEEDSIELKSKSEKGNRLFKMLKTAEFQHYDSTKGELSKFSKGEEDRKRIASKLSSVDKKNYKEWLKTTEGEESINKFNEFASSVFKNKIIQENLNPFNLSDDNLIPDSLIDTFITRIKRVVDMGATKGHRSIETELNRIRSLNDNKIPKKIQEFLDTIQ